MIRIEIAEGQAIIVEEISELPDLSSAKELFLDIESTSFDDTKEALYPYGGDRIAGFAVTIDDLPQAWYIPIRHRSSRWNLPLDSVQKWIKTALPKKADWINHNVKFDAHFMLFDGYEHDGRMIDTVVLAKLLNSELGEYGLKPLARRWLDAATTEADEVDAYLSSLLSGNRKGKDYGAVPGDLLGRYACRDVFLNRRLYRYLQTSTPSEVKPVWDVEIPLTPVLFDMERTGIFALKKELEISTTKSIRRLLEIHARIAEITGLEYTDHHVHLYDIFSNQMGLPVLGFSDGGNPSYDTDILNRYLSHPQVLATENAEELVNLVIEERSESHYKSLFLDSFREYIDDTGFIHPSFNQVVRTGRMSCQRPNMQQQNKRSKRLVRTPPDGWNGVDKWAILRYDASQIEFRLIAHYIQDENLIKAYNEDPNTDIHDWMAKISHTNRDAGKTLNFGMGFGAGIKKVTSELAGNPQIMREVGELVNRLVLEGKIDESKRDFEYRALCQQRAEEVYKTYHEKVPNLKLKARQASEISRARGFVFNWLGRRRHLGREGCHKAFNTVIQGGALDYIKTRMNKLAPRYNKKVRDLGLLPVINVHDELVWYGPRGSIYDPEVRSYINSTLCEQPIQFRVPFIWNGGLSDKYWSLASGKERYIDENGTLLDGPLEEKEAKKTFVVKRDGTTEEVVKNQ